MEKIISRVYLKDIGTPADVGALLGGADRSGEAREFTFNRFVRMPHELWFDGRPLLADVGFRFLKSHPDGLAPEGGFRPSAEALAFGRRALVNELNFGHPTFEGWCLKHWGCVTDAECLSVREAGNGRFILDFVTSDVPRPVARAVRRELGEKLVAWLWRSAEGFARPAFAAELEAEGFDTTDLTSPAWFPLDVRGYDDDL